MEATLNGSISVKMLLYNKRELAMDYRAQITMHKGRLGTTEFNVRVNNHAETLKTDNIFNSHRLMMKKMRLEPC